MKKIFEYDDYRRFLTDYYMEKKKSTGYFTYRYFAALANFSSPVFLKLVMEGKSKISEKSIASLTVAMNLTPPEAKYFATLVHFNQAKSFEAKKRFFAELRSISENAKVAIVDADQYDFYANWYTSVLRELIPSCQGSVSTAALRKMVYPSISAREVKKALALLVRTGLLAKKDDGSYAQTTKLISTGSEVESLAVRDLHLQMSRLASSAIENVPKEDRDISGLTIGVSAKTFERIAKELEEVRSRIMAMVVDDPKVERVYRLNLQLFPLSKKRKIRRPS
jgi:uncharacterized protein (TIGR02147 family)